MATPDSTYQELLAAWCEEGAKKGFYDPEDEDQEKPAGFWLCTEDVVDEVTQLWDILDPHNALDRSVRGVGRRVMLERKAHYTKRA